MLRKAEQFLLQRFQHIRNRSVFICSPLEIEDYVTQPIPEVSPPKWHLAHTTWFFENFILKKFVKGYQLFDMHFDLLFNSYYKSCGKHWIQANRGVLSRPTVENVHAYRAYVDEQMCHLLANGEALLSEVKYLTEVGLQHEQQHQELLFMDIKYILSVNPSMPAYTTKPLLTLHDSKRNWIDYDEGVYEVGFCGEGFHYDNEAPRHKLYLTSFSLCDQFVLNSEYLEFINDDGYANPLLWLSDGWNWVTQHQITSPLYWHKKDDQWHEYTLYGDHAIIPEFPVCHVSYYEADAFARWKGMRLPREDELEIVLSDMRGDQTWLDDYCHTTDAHIANKQLWAWTQSAYSPYPGYKSFAGALGEYNGKFMCNQQVLRGGAFVTPSEHYRHTYRNFYFPHQNWMFSGICLAKI